MSVIIGLVHYGGEVMLCRRLARSTCSVLSSNESKKIDRCFLCIELDYVCVVGSVFVGMYQ